MPRRKDKQGVPVFGSFVRRLRMAKGVSLHDLARATGIPHATWSRGERGLLDLRRWDYVIPLADALGLPLGEMAKDAGIDARPIDRFDMIEIEGVHREPSESGPGVAAKGGGSIAAQAGVPQVGVVVRATASLLEEMGPDVGEFQKALSAVLHESHGLDDPGLLREVTAYARGVLARSRAERHERRPNRKASG